MKKFTEIVGIGMYWQLSVELNNSGYFFKKNFLKRICPGWLWSKILKECPWADIQIQSKKALNPLWSHLGKQLRQNPDKALGEKAHFYGTSASYHLGHYMWWEAEGERENVQNFLQTLFKESSIALPLPYNFHVTLPPVISPSALFSNILFTSVLYMVPSHWFVRIGQRASKAIDTGNSEGGLWTLACVIWF